MNADEVVARIDRQALIDFTLEICNIDSPVGFERNVLVRIEDWLVSEGFEVRKLGLLPDRYNLLARLPGEKGGRPRLMFNGHLDTYAPAHKDLVQIDATRDELHKAWVEGDLLVGDGVVNDKGPVAAFLMAAKAIKDSGVKLKHDLLLSCVIAETAYEQVSNEPGEIVDSKELGARYLATHGGIADYVIVAEGTGFALGWVEAGKLWFKITVLGDQPSLYTPYMPERTEPARSPNMIVAATKVVDAFETWAAEYEKKTRMTSAGGMVHAKAQIGAIRSGEPARPFLSPQICEIFVDVRTLPGQNPIDTQMDLLQALSTTGLNCKVELYLYRRGYEATGVGPVVAALTAAHQSVFGTDPPPVSIPTTSMWRDSNIFSELGIPVVNYGPRSATHAYKRALTADSLYDASCVYARAAMEICG